MPVCAIPCTSLLCTYQCIALPTLVQAYVGIGWEFDHYFSSINYPTPGGSSCNQKAHQSQATAGEDLSLYRCRTMLDIQVYITLT